MIFLVSNNGTLINMFSLQNVVLDKNEYAIYYIIYNGARIIDKFSSLEEAEEKYNEIVSSLLFVKVSDVKAISVYSIKNISLKDTDVEIEMNTGANQKLNYSTKDEAEVAYDNLLQQLKSLNLDGTVEPEHSEVPSWVKGISLEDITKWNNKSDFDGEYSSLKGVPNIPTKVSQLENDTLYVSFGELNSKLNVVKNDIKNLKDITGQNKSDIDVIKNELEVIGTIEDEVKALEKTIIQLQQASIVHSGDISSIYTKIDNINKHISIVNGQYQDTMQEILKINSEIKIMGDTLDGLNEFVTSLIGGEGGKITDITKELSELKIKTDNMQSIINTIPSDISDFDKVKSNIVSINSALILMENRIELLSDKIDKIDIDPDEIEKIQNDITILKTNTQDIGTMRSDIAQLKIDIGQIDDALSAILGE